MGAEELKKRRKSHDKYIDRKRVELATPDLFTQLPTYQRRCAVALIEADVTVAEGECLEIESRDGLLFAHRGNTLVATFKVPPPDIVDALSSGIGLAKGTVIRVYALSRTAEVSFS